MIWSRKKGKKRFYSAYKELINKSVITEVETVVPEYKKEKKVKEKKKRDIEKTCQKSITSESYSSRPVIISVSSLKNGIGCTHICHLIESYINTKGYTVAIVDNFERMIEFGDTLDYIIIDHGNIDINLIHMYRFSQIKIMVCVLDVNYLRKLHDHFLTTDKLYFFSYVPGNLKREVADYMEDYNYFCVPTCIPEALNKEVKKEFEKVLKI